MICPKCNRDNLDGSRYCSHCGTEFQRSEPKPAQRTSWTKKILIGLGIFFVLVMLMGILLLSGKRTGSVTSLSPAPKLDRGFIALVEQGTRDGLLDVDLRINKVYIEPITWNNMDAKTKKWFATNMAVYCQSKGLNGKWVKIYDKQSAKKLAEYDAWGFEVY